MTTALDTNVLLDIVGGDERFGDLSLEAVERAAAAGGLVVSDPVYAELSATFASQRSLDQFLDENQIAVRSLNREALFRAGRAWKAYRRAGGTRTRILTDFLIGAHAELECSALLTRDRGFYRDRFAALVLIDPSAGEPRELNKRHRD
jgi:predicted nucleic acid-binding protein